MSIKLEGFHGTDYARFDHILKDGFKPSSGDIHWLGDGCYFFLSGLNLRPDEQAERWAIVSAWDKDTRKNKYQSYVVLLGKIEVEENKFLDLTTANGIEILDYIQYKCTSKLAILKKRIEFIDGFLINFARSEELLDVEVAKGSFYIKLRKEDRINHLSRRTPNCTICTVYDPKKNVTKIEKVKMGEF